MKKKEGMSVVTSYHRPTQLIIDSDAIRQNMHQVKAHCQAAEDIFAVVKANGYGHGAVPIAKIALEEGAKGCCVATIDEAIELREAGITAPILILGVVDVQYLPIISTYEFAIPLATTQWLTEAIEWYTHTPWENNIALHMAVDTGMGRIGFTTIESICDTVSRVTASEGFFIEGIFTHFSTADEADQTYTKQQNQRFEEVLASLPSRPRYIHSANSASELWQESEGNLIRYGIALYGLNPSGNTLALPYPLMPALELVSKVVQVKKVPKGSKIGYGATYEALEDEWIATIPIGYADGYIRKMQGFHVLIEGQYCEIVGRVCMDQIMVRLPHEVPLDVPVVLVGEMNKKTITLQDVATHIGTIHYEVACLFSERLPRIYK